MHISQQKRVAALKKREAILRYLLDNPGIKQTLIADKFGLSTAAVSVHVSHIRRGWRPEGWVDPVYGRRGDLANLDRSNE